MKISHIITALVALILGAALAILVMLSLPASMGVATPNLTKAEALITKVTQGNATILTHFPAIGNIEGFVVTTKIPSDKRGILYADNAGRYLVNDTLIDANGQDISQQNYYQYVQPQAASNAYQSIAQTAWIQQGSDKAPHKFYVILDPNCIFCHQAFVALTPKIAAGEVQVRWIIVGLIKPTSKGKALAILNATDSLLALQQNEQSFNEQTEEGGIAPLAISGPVSTDKLSMNMAFIQQNQIIQTPTFFYKDSAGIMHLQAGTPNSMDSFVAGTGNQF